MVFGLLHKTTHITRKNIGLIPLLALTLCLSIPDTAAAQAHSSSSKPYHCAASSGSTNTGYGAKCDARYRDLVHKGLQYKCTAEERAIAGSEVTKCRSVEGTRPPGGKGIRHITTPLKSLIKDYSPYLFYNLNVKDWEEEQKRMVSMLYTGTPNSPRAAFSMIGPENDEAPVQGRDPRKKKFAQCVDQIRTSSKPSTPEEYAKLIRLKLDNCANQFILNSALGPAHKENSDLYSHDTPNNPTRRIGQYSHCQPLKMKTDAATEYHAINYIKGAWIKLLEKPQHRINPSAPKEPTMPAGITYKNPIPPPNPLPDIKTNMLLATPYEEIIDPTHPFSPRWDFNYNERDKFSPMTEEYGGDEKNEVFCAGDKEDKIYKVDILTFRDKATNFSQNMEDRIKFNEACDANSGAVAYPCCTLTWGTCCKGNFCYPCPIDCAPQDCQTCYDFSAEEPTCATNYKTDPDRKRLLSQYTAVPPYLRRSSNFTDEPTLWAIVAWDKKPNSRIASCDPKELRQNSSTVETMCEKLRAPLVPLNKLKMRYHDPEKLDESELPSGVPDGLSFNDYFSSEDDNEDGKRNDGHMPYMRLLDTGESLQENSASGQDPMDNLGQYTSVVGVGVEAVAGDDEKKDQRCLLGGWGDDVSFAGVSFKKHDPITSWTELKMHQAYSARRKGMYCLGRYEKVFKMEATEDRALLSASPSLDKLAARTGSDVKEEVRKEQWPYPFLGYISDVEEDSRFPNLPDDDASLITGLDNAVPGDIILMPKGAAMDGDPKPGLPKLCYVIDPTSDGFQKQKNCTDLKVEPSNDPSKCKDAGNCKILVYCADDGSAPTSCGTTDALGQNISRYFYKEGYAKELVKSDFESVDSDMDCKDINLHKCIFKPWDTVKIYRPCKDDRLRGSSSAGNAAP